MNVYNFLTFFVFVIDGIFAQSESCNPFECFNVLDTLFQFNSAEEPCQKVIKLEKCAKTCSLNSKDNIIIKGIEEMKKDLCGNDHSFQLANKCENKHKYLLFACIYENLHLEAVQYDVNQSLLMCRQASEGQHCDIQSLSLCTSREHYLSEVILKSFFRPIERKHCHFAIGTIFDLKLKPLGYMDDYKKLAECLDRSSPHISECIPKKWVVTNAVIGTHFESKLCRAGDSFLSCVRDIIHNKCGELENTFANIGQSLYKTFLPQCSKLSEVSSALKTSEISDKHLNEVHDSFTTDAPKNSSEVVVVHQHVVINLNYHETNAAAANRIH
ncbi:unnamed protein product [Larinioides sclopetarius]|uniref:CPG4 domain-containing protein n=1 Tax=Larinioides sclopetarius TaxID=280406 RepID=A0AAV2A9L5_9ARAC